MMRSLKYMPDISIIIPVYNEEAVVHQLTERLDDVFFSQPDVKVEILIINDGSDDETSTIIDEIAVFNAHYKAVHLSRNFGHQQAVTAGLSLASGEYVVVMDGDLQDPPEVILPMYNKVKCGFDVVYAIRCSRKESIFKKIAYSTFYKVLRAMSPIEIPIDSGDFCIMSRRAVDAINALPEKHRFVRGLRSYVGFKQVSFEYERKIRAAGRPKYNLRKLLRLAADGIFTFSDMPLKLATWLGFGVSILSIFYTIYVLFIKIFFNIEPAGFATLSVGIFFIGGIQLICIGILGEYIARIHNEVKSRSNFIVDYITEIPQTDKNEESHYH